MVNKLGNFDIIEEEDYGSSVPTIKDVALMHIRKISEICCQEFTAGYWQDKPMKVGGGVAITRTYHPDVRATFINAVDFLLWIVYPSADPEFKEFADELEKNKPEDVKEQLEQRKQLFREMNIMFERTGFFDNESFKTLTSK